jgi:hypothetical protein
MALDSHFTPYLSYLSVMKQRFSLVIFQHKHQRKLNFSIPGCKNRLCQSVYYCRTQAGKSTRLERTRSKFPPHTTRIYFLLYRKDERKTRRTDPLVEQQYELHGGVEWWYPHLHLPSSLHHRSPDPCTRSLAVQFCPRDATVPCADASDPRVGPRPRPPSQQTSRTAAQ